MMANDRLPKQLLFGTTQLEQTSRSRTNHARLRNSWSDYVRDDSIKLKVPYNWYKLAQDRAEWSEKNQDNLGTHLAYSLKCEID